MMRTSAGKRAMLSCLVAGAALSLGLGAAVICAGAESGGTVFEENNVTVVMDPGAAIRKFKDDEIENGIRFCAVLTNSAYEALEKLETETVNVTYGMLVASAEDVAEHGALNAENVFGDNAVYYWESDDSKADPYIQFNFNSCNIINFHFISFIII